MHGRGRGGPRSRHTSGSTTVARTRWRSSAIRRGRCRGCGGRNTGGRGRPRKGRGLPSHLAPSRCSLQSPTTSGTAEASPGQGGPWIPEVVRGPREMNRRARTREEEGIRGAHLRQVCGDRGEDRCGRGARIQGLQRRGGRKEAWGTRAAPYAWRREILGSMEGGCGTGTEGGAGAVSGATSRRSANGTLNLQR